MHIPVPMSPLLYVRTYEIYIVVSRLSTYFKLGTKLTLNICHFKKCFKKGFLAIADFLLLQAFAAWN